MHRVLFPCLFVGGGGFTADSDQKTFQLVQRYELTNSPDRLIKDCLQALLREGGTFEVFNSPNVLRHSNTLRVLDGCHTAEMALLETNQ